MFRIRRGMYANIVATLALVLAMSGGAYAAGKISGKQIAKNAITSKHIKDGEVHSVDLAADAKAALTGPAGPAGAAGATGSQGPQGAPGTPGLSGYQVVTGSSAAAAVAEDWLFVTVTCPLGKKPLSWSTDLVHPDPYGAGPWYTANINAKLTPAGDGYTFYGVMPQSYGIIGQVICANVS